jgi:hypothetical protein
MSGSESRSASASITATSTATSSSTAIRNDFSFQDGFRPLTLSLVSLYGENSTANVLRFGLLPSEDVAAVNVSQVSALLNDSLPRALDYAPTMSHTIVSARPVAPADVVLASRFAVGWPDVDSIGAFAGLGWVLTVSVAAPGGVLRVFLPSSAVQAVSGAVFPSDAPLTAACTYVHPIAWRLVTSGPGDDGGGGAYFSVAISLPPPPLYFSSEAITARAAAGGVGVDAVTASRLDATVSVLRGSDSGVSVDSGWAPAGIRPFNFSGPGTLIAATLQRPFSLPGYEFDVLFPGSSRSVTVRIAAGTLVTSYAGAPVSAANAADLWLSVPYVAPVPPSSTSPTWFQVGQSWLCLAQ